MPSMAEDTSARCSGVTTRSASIRRYLVETKSLLEHKRRTALEGLAIVPRALGVGLVWWPPLDDLCRDGEGLVDVIEAEPESYWVPLFDGRGFRSFLGEALQHLSQPKLLHGVGAPVGGTCSPPDGHLAALAADVAELR